MQESVPRQEIQALSDEHLACRAQEGCAASFEELVRRYQVPILHFLRHKSFAVDDVEDMTQETFLRAYRKLRQYRGDRAFRPWLFTLAYHVALNAQRDKRRAERARPMQEAINEAASQPDSQADPEAHRRLWNVAEDVLSQPQFTAVWLYYVEQLSIREIAFVLKRSNAAVKTTLFRARQRLEPFLQEFAENNESATKKRQTPR